MRATWQFIAAMVVVGFIIVALAADIGGLQRFAGGGGTSLVDNRSSAQSGPPLTEFVEQAMRAALPDGKCYRELATSECRSSNITVRFKPSTPGFSERAELAMYLSSREFGPPRAGGREIDKSALTTAGQLLRKVAGFNALEVDNCASDLREARHERVSLSCRPWPPHLILTVVWDSF
jgi:hypothetical protein